MNRREFMRSYWRYYLILEEKFINLTRYIEPHENNNSVFSIELVNQLLTIGSEIDVVMKEICGIPQSERKTINDYCPIILMEFSDIKSQKAQCYGEMIKPFENWTQEQASKSLFWWEAYNLVKHSREEKFSCASFKVVLYALSALCMLEVLYIKKLSNGQSLLDRPDKESGIFSFPDIQYQYVSQGEIVVEMQQESKSDPAEVDTLIMDGNL